VDLVLDQAHQEVDQGMVHQVVMEAEVVGIAETSNVKVLLLGTMTENQNASILVAPGSSRLVPKVTVCGSVLLMVRRRVSVEVGLFIAFYLVFASLFSFIVRVSITHAVHRQVYGQASINFVWCLEHLFRSVSSCQLGLPSSWWRVGLTATIPLDGFPSRRLLNTTVKILFIAFWTDESIVEASINFLNIFLQATATSHDLRISEDV